MARHHHDGAFYFVDCKFSQSMVDRAPYRVIYPLDGGQPSRADIERNRELDKTNIWGERNYFFNSHRDGGDYEWMADNLGTAPGAPNPAMLTAAWTFAENWDPEDPESKIGPKIVGITGQHGQHKLRFSEPVTVKGRPRLVISDGRFADYASGSGSEVLVFDAAASEDDAQVTAVDFHGGRILASQAAAAIRLADVTMPSRADRRLTIVLVGDSTVTDGSGWGLGFKKCLDANVECINSAQNGRSSKSFRDEGRWEPVLELKPDYVLLQFGHNDQPGKGPERESPADTAYRANMKRYVDEARAAGIHPVLVTSLVRRHFDSKGNIRSDLTQYVDVVKQVAAETNTPLVDLHELSIVLCESLGEDECKSIEPVTSGKQDTTHLNGKGSELVGRLVANELANVVPELAPNIRGTEERDGR
jgi:lysophospholipase L1-like esterase